MTCNQIIKKRTGVFETNSSSTHSICIPKEKEYVLPKTIHFKLGYFGWEWDILSTTEALANYLYTGFIYNNRETDFMKIVTFLESKGITVTLESYKEDKYYEGIDHSGELDDFLTSLCSDEEKLLTYLFSGLSFIRTGNDNEEEVLDNLIDSKTFEVYYKGN